VNNLPGYDALDLPREGELRLRAWRSTDIPAVLAACLEPSTSQWVAPLRDYDEAKAAAYVLGAPADWAARHHLRLCLTDSTDAVLGSADLDGLSLRHSRGELGWWVAPGARGRGLGVRMARLLVRLGFDTLGLHRLYAEIVAPNAASRWVAAGAGLRLESTAVGSWVGVDGVRHDMQTWRLLAAEKPLEAQPELTAGALHLRPWRPSDAADVQAACSDPEIARWTYVPVPYTASVASAWVGSEALTAWATGRGAHFAVLDSVSGALLGSVGVTNRDRGVWEIGWWVAPAARGRGVATDAARTLLRWLRAATDVSVVEWRAVVGNVGSRIVASRLGFTFEGVQRARFAKDGVREDDWVGSLLRAEIT
jgi:RimJ/RimL family protein N-acetyltransferase